MIKRNAFNLTMLALAGSVVASPVLAQDSTAGNVAQAAAALGKGFAGSSFQIPVANGAGWGSAGAGVYVQTVDSPSNDYDGSMGLNLGLGNPAEYVGLSLAANLSSLTGSGGPDSFGEAGSFGAKLHTNLPGLTSFAVGVNGIGRFGQIKKVGTSSVYAVISKGFVLGTQGLTAHLGVGDNGFTTPGKSGIGVFGGLAYHIIPQLSLIAENTGRFSNVAVSWAPIKSWPVTITGGATNLEQRFGLDTQFGLSVATGINF